MISTMLLSTQMHFNPEALYFRVSLQIVAPGDVPLIQLELCVCVVSYVLIDFSFTFQLQYLCQ